MTLRNGKELQHEANKMSQLMSDWLESVDHVGMFKTCASCSYMGNDDRTCSKFNAQPPVSVVVNACPQYKDRTNSFASDFDDDIPF